MAEPFALEFPGLLDAAILDPAPFVSGQDQPQAGEQQFLKFPLTTDTTALIAVEQLTEILTLNPTQILPIPDMPDWVMGVYNWRGEILWVLDLVRLLAISTLQNQISGATSFKVVVARNQAQTYLGLALKDVDEMCWCHPDRISSPPDAVITPGLAPYLQGYTLDKAGEMLMVLNAAAIFDRLLTDRSPI